MSSYTIMDLMIMPDLRDGSTWPPLMSMALTFLQSGSKVAVVASADQYIRWKKLREARKLINSGDLRLFTNVSVRTHANLYRQCRGVILDGPDGRSVERLVTDPFLGTKRLVIVRTSEHNKVVIEAVRRLAPGLREQAFRVRPAHHWWDRPAYKW